MPMKEKCTLIISSLAYALEMIITIAMLIGTGLLCFRLICSIFHLMDADPFEAYEHLLSLQHEPDNLCRTDPHDVLSHF